jgi:hypothetical protein
LPIAASIEGQPGVSHDRQKELRSSFFSDERVVPRRKEKIWGLSRGYRLRNTITDIRIRPSESIESPSLVLIITRTIKPIRTNLKIRIPGIPPLR